MSEDDKVFNFAKCLNSYGQIELLKAQPKDLAAVMDLNLGDQSLSKNVESLKFKRKPKFPTGKEGQKKDKSKKKGGGNNSGNSNRGRQASLLALVVIFVMVHRVANCSKREKLSTLIGEGRDLTLTG